MLSTLMAGSLLVSTQIATLNGSNITLNGSPASVVGHTLGTGSNCTVTIPAGTYLLEAPYKVKSNTIVHAEGAKFIVDSSKFANSATSQWGQFFGDPGQYDFSQDYRTILNMAFTA
ncbi:MAG: hypothetical protein ABUL72_03880, partial [Armatimonadota bacterium]